MDTNSISTALAGALYGKGVFTTVRIAGGKPFLWKKHWRRLRANAEKIGIDISDYSEKSLLAALGKLADDEVIADGRARVTLFDGRPASIWPSDVSGDTTVSIIVDEPRPIPGVFKLTLSPFSVNSNSPLAGVKSCNYLDKLMALDEAKGRGFHEAVMLNERGQLTSAVMANLFWLNGGKLFTPSLGTGCLAGTTREFVMENFECREVEVGLDVLHEAEAIFLTSAGLGIVTAAVLDSHRLVTDHPILDLWPQAV